MRQELSELVAFWDGQENGMGQGRTGDICIPKNVVLKVGRKLWYLFHRLEEGYCSHAGYLMDLASYANWGMRTRNRHSID